MPLPDKPAVAPRPSNDHWGQFRARYKKRFLPKVTAMLVLLISPGGSSDEPNSVPLTSHFPRTPPRDATPRQGVRSRGVTRANLREVCRRRSSRGTTGCLVRRYGFWGLLGVFLFALAVAALPPRASADGPWCRVPCSAAAAHSPPTVRPGIRWRLVLDAKPEEEKRVVAAIYNRYCIRCHGVDGRGVWDIPDVPDFTNGAGRPAAATPVWQRSSLKGEER